MAPLWQQVRSRLDRGSPGDRPGSHPSGVSNTCSISAYTPRHGLPVDALRPRRQADGARTIDFAGVERTALTRGAWVDVARAWLPDADDVFETLVRDVPWRAERRQMYDRVVDVPRLVHTYMIGDELPHAGLTDAREALSAHYADELGEPFRTAGCCYYRDGRD